MRSPFKHKSQSQIYMKPVRGLFTRRDHLCSVDDFGIMMIIPCRHHLDEIRKLNQRKSPELNVAQSEEALGTFPASGWSRPSSEAPSAFGMSSHASGPPG